MALPRRKVAVCFTARPLQLRMLLAVGLVGIYAAGSWIDAHDGGSQLANRNILPEAVYRGMNCMP